MKVPTLMAASLMALSLPAPAARASPQALCCLARQEVSTAPSPLSHGIRLEVVCAHADRPVVGFEPAGSTLVFRDGRQDLIEAGRRWLQRDRKENPSRMVFTTRSLNAIEIKDPDRRVLPIEVHSNSLPKETDAILQGVVVVYVAGPQTTTVTTTVQALRQGTPIQLSADGMPPAVPVPSGTSNDAPMVRLSGGAAFEALLSGPDGVRTTTFVGQRLLVVGTDVPDEAPVQLRLRLGERLKLPVHIKVRIEGTPLPPRLSGDRRVEGFQAAA